MRTDEPSLLEPPTDFSSSLLEEYNLNLAYYRNQPWRGINSKAARDLNLDLISLPTTPNKKPPSLSIGNAADDLLSENVNTNKRFSSMNLAGIGNESDQIYQRLIQFSLIHIDMQYGIRSDFTTESYKNTTEKYDHRSFYVRDAKKAIPLTHPNRLSPNHPSILMENLLLRQLSIARAINFHLSQIYQEAPHYQPYYTYLQAILRRVMMILYQQIEDYQSSYDRLSESHWPSIVKRLETACNNSFCDLLHHAGLTQGIHTPHQFEKLLLHYRNMAAVIDPACVIQTISHDGNGNTEIIQTAYPITEKSPDQKSLIENTLGDVSNAPRKKNFHSAKPVAIQKVSYAFRSCLSDDQRMLGAQTRKTIAPGAKNAYLCEMQIRKDNEKEARDKLNYSRSATFAYVGNGEKDKQRKEAIAKQNIEQVFAIMKSMTELQRIHFLQLVTNVSWQHQNEAYAQTKNAISTLPDASTTYAPTDPLGMFARPKPAKTVINQQTNTSTKLQPGLLGQRDKRVRYGVEVANLASTLPKTMNHLSCMSGMDRTSTSAIAYENHWAKAVVEREHLQCDVDATTAAAMHHVVTLGFITPGSMGLKASSNTGAIPKESADAYYLPVARTNKSAPISKKFIQRHCQSTPRLLEIEIEQQIDALQRQCNYIEDPTRKEHCQNVINRVSTKSKKKKCDKEHDVLSILKKLNGIVAGDMSQYDSLLRITHQLYRNHPFAKAGYGLPIFLAYTQPMLAMGLTITSRLNRYHAIVNAVLTCLDHYQPTANTASLTETDTKEAMDAYDASLFPEQPLSRPNMKKTQSTQRALTSTL